MPETNEYPAEDMPIGLMMQMAHNTRAMDGFFSMEPSRKQALLNYIRASSTGDEAKSRIEHAIEALAESSDFNPNNHMFR